jgi:hypothetical protein
MPDLQTGTKKPRRGRKAPKEKGESLKAVAEREALEAEAEAPANGVASEPGENGIATQDPETEAKAGAWDRAPSQDEFNLAHDVLTRLRDHAHEMGAEAVIDSLHQLVDVHPQFRMSQTWPGDPEDPIHPSSLLGEIGRFMIRGCPKIEIDPRKVAFFWKNAKTWTSKGVMVLADAKTLPLLGVHLTGGCLAAVVGNYQAFRLLNTRRKLAAIYHALRSVDASGKQVQPHWAGFFDEIALFGTGTFEQDAHLRRAVELGAQRELPFETAANAFDEMEEVDPDAEPAGADA